MNNFATTYRVIQARKLERQPDPAEVAVLTVLQTEFPALIQDMVEEPRLLEALVDATHTEHENASEKLKALVAPTPSPYRVTDGSRRRHRRPPQPCRAPAHRRRQVRRSRERGARLKLNQQLDGYIAYIHGADIQFRPSTLSTYRTPLASKD